MLHRTHDLRTLVLNDNSLASHRLREDIEEHGLAVFDDDGIEPELYAGVQKYLDDFFALPLEEKKVYERADDGRQRGYTPPRTEHALDQSPDAADLKEFWQEGPANSVELGLLPNLVTAWPAFDTARNLVHTKLRERVDVVHRVIAPILGVSPEWLIRYAGDGDDIVRFLEYFDLLEFDFPDGTLRSAPHTDINLITLLKTFGEGLVVKSISGEVIELDIGPRQLVVQMGDMIEVLSGGLLPATTHWVKNMPGRRTSIALFNHPDPLRIIDILPHLLERWQKLGKAPWIPRTERRFTSERLVAINILEGPPKHANELYVQGNPLGPLWSSHI